MQSLVTEFNGKLACHLEYGQYFDIDVMAVEQTRSFQISLANKKLNDGPDSDIGLRVLVSFIGNQIEANARYENSWTTDLTADCDGSDIAKSSIKINVYLSDTSFHVSLNGVHKLRLFYRFNIEKLEAIQIAGDINLITRVDHRKIYPSLWPPTSCPPGLAFSNDIPIPFQPGHLMVITGRCFGEPKGQLGFNIKHAHNSTQMLHFNPRFNTGIVVRNSLVPRNDGSLGYIYGTEESTGGFPFDFYKPFRMGIGCRDTEFVVAINGLFFSSFMFRDPLQNDLSNMVGLQVVGANGTGIKITEVDHIQLHDPACSNLENYTKLQCQEDKENSKL